MRKVFIQAICLLGFLTRGAVAEMPSEHFLSFIIPCFNCYKTVERSIDSIYEQNIGITFEVICTDDTSTDDTLLILQSYENKYENFHVYRHEKNLGGGAASNICVRYAKGDWLFRLDADNALSADSINRLVALLDETGCDGASVEELRFYKGDFIKSSNWIYPSINNISYIQNCVQTTINPAASGNYLFTRKSYDKAGGYPESRSGADTFCLGFKQYATGTKIAILPDSFYWHFVNPEGYWNREQKTGTNEKVALAVMLEFSEIFSPDTLKRLKGGHRNFAEEINGGNIHLASLEILDCLFKGYEFEYLQEYDKAIFFFEQAVFLGCNAEKITKKINQLKKAKK